MNESNNEQINSMTTTNEPVNTEEHQSVNQNIVEPQINTEPQTQIITEPVQPQPNVGAVPLVQQPLNNNVTSEVPKKKSNKGLIIILILVALIIVVGVVYYLMKNNSNEITSDNEITTTKTVVEETTTITTEKTTTTIVTATTTVVSEENSSICSDNDCYTIGEYIYVLNGGHYDIYDKSMNLIGQTKDYKKLYYGLVIGNYAFGVSDNNKYAIIDLLTDAILVEFDKEYDENYYSGYNNGISAEEISFEIYRDDCNNEASGLEFTYNFNTMKTTISNVIASHCT